MGELLAALMAFPTAVFTLLVGVAVLYWLSVIAGALDIDMFSGDAVDAMAGKGEAAAGALDGLSAKGEALDALGADGVEVEGFGGDGADLDADLDVGGDGLEAHAGDGFIIHAFNLRRAPITVVFSFIVFVGWIVSYSAMKYLAPIVPLPAWVFGTAVLLGATLIAVPVTSFATRPLEPLFKNKGGKTRADYVGTVCRIQTGRVDERFGQARIEEGGTEMVIQVRGDGSKLNRGDRAIIVEYDEEREAYVVEAYEDLLQEDAPKRARK